MFGVAILRRCLDLVFKEVREVDHLSVGQIGLVIRKLLQSRSDLVAQAVA